MAIKLGIAGLPMSGKSTTLEAFISARGAGQQQQAGGRQVRQEMVRVEDPRLGPLTEMFHPKKTTPATLQIVDAPGMFDPHAGSTGIGKGYFAQIRDCESLLIVARVFASDSVAHPRETVDPGRDLDLFLSDLMVDDLGVMERRLEKLAVSVHKEQKDKREALLAEQELLQRVQAQLEEGKWPGGDFVTPDEKRVLAAYALFTLKRIIVLANVGDLSSSVEQERLAGLRKVAERYGFPVVVLNAALEVELAEFEPEERQEYYESMGLEVSGEGGHHVDAIIREAYGALGFHSFLTVGEDEVRAWTIQKGDTALKAAAAIHSDLARGFICAEVVPYDELMADGSMAKAREHGHLRQESRDYVVRDGDIINVRFNV